MKSCGLMTGIFPNESPEQPLLFFTLSVDKANCVPKIFRDEISKEEKMDVANSPVVVVVVVMVMEVLVMVFMEVAFKPEKLCCQSIIPLNAMADNNVFFFFM